MPSQLFETVKIPKERIGVLIGENGKVKKRLETLSETAVDVDSETGLVEIEGKGNSANFLDAVNAVKAVGRGFSPEKAFLLLGEGTMLDVIKVPDLIHVGEKSLKTKKGRVIGSKGMARDLIERETNAKISVFGKTIALIGRPNEVELARKAVEMLLHGAKHKTVEDFLKMERIAGEKFTI